MNRLLLDALFCSNTSRPPVWLMRQAGRYMPQYRKIREKRTFLQMCKEPEIAAEVTLLPIKEFGMDAAILFSDILVVSEALGLNVHFQEGKGPVIEKPLSNKKDVANLKKANIAESQDYMRRAIKLLIPELKVPLIGFSGAPFTIASYLIEGGTSRDLKKTKKWMLEEPESFHTLLDLIADCVADSLNLQISSGVNAVQIFDSWASFLGYRQFREFSLDYLKKIVGRLQALKTPVILFCRGSSVFFKDLLEAGAQGISLDWNISLPFAREAVPKTTALQGNLDPDILYAPKGVVISEVQKLLKSMKGDKGYIFNLGHGVKPDIPVEAVRALVDTVKNFQ